MNRRHPLAQLPLDVGRLIIEDLADDLMSSNPKECLNLSLVSRQFKEWTEPIIYRSLVFDDRKTVQQLLWTLSNSRTKPAKFFASHVKFLVITYVCDLDTDSIALILRQCPGIISLAFWFPDLDFKYPSETALPLTNLRRLSIPVHSPLFPNDLEKLTGLTHLELHFRNIESALAWAHWKPLNQLKQLEYVTVLLLRPNRLVCQDVLTDLVRVCQENMPPACKVFTVEPCESDVIAGDALFKQLDGKEDRVLVMLADRAVDVSEYRTVEYPHMTRRLVCPHERDAVVREWDGYRYFTGEKDFWDIAVDAIEKARKGFDGESWEV